jgi:hypothetical protein
MSHELLADSTRRRLSSHRARSIPPPPRAAPRSATNFQRMGVAAVACRPPRRHGRSQPRKAGKVKALIACNGRVFGAFGTRATCSLWDGAITFNDLRVVRDRRGPGVHL